MALRLYRIHGRQGSNEAADFIHAVIDAESQKLPGFSAVGVR